MWGGAEQIPQCEDSEKRNALTTEEIATGGQQSTPQGVHSND